MPIAGATTFDEQTRMSSQNMSEAQQTALLPSLNDHLLEANGFWFLVELDALLLNPNPTESQRTALKMYSVLTGWDKDQLSKRREGLRAGTLRNVSRINRL